MPCIKALRVPQESFDPTGNARIVIISPTRPMQPGNSRRMKKCDTLPTGLPPRAETPPLSTAVAREATRDTRVRGWLGDGLGDVGYI